MDANSIKKANINQDEKDCVLNELKKSSKVGAFDAYYKCVCLGKEKCSFYNLFPPISAKSKDFVSLDTATDGKFVYYDERRSGNYFSYSDTCWQKLN